MHALRRMTTGEQLEQRLHLYGTVMYRVNAGGPQVNDVPVWTADTTANPSPYVNAAADGNLTFSTASAINMSDPSVPPGTPQALFQNERYNTTTNPEMQWTFPVTAGNYTVKLYFAEIFSGVTAAGQRQFNVAIDGTTVLSKFDVFGTVGANKAVVKSFNVNDTGTTLNVNFTHVLENPAIKAIEIDKNTVVPGQVDASLQYVSFGSTPIGSTASHALTLSNLAPAGSAAITVKSLNFTGTNAAQFTDNFNNSAGITLQPGQSQTFNVTYTPSLSALNAVSASLSIVESTSAGAAPTVTIPVSAWQLATNGTSGVSFGKSILAGTALSAPTSVQFGPDGKLYVSQQDGVITQMTISRTAANNYTVTSTQNITLIENIPNHNDDGSLAPTITGRTVTGILVVGTAANPIIYVSSSDPRVTPGTTNPATNTDTDSGIISKLTWNGTTWVKQDLVRGLPRSAVDHATNGLQLNAATNTLYVAQAGLTNMGAPSNNFGEYPEYAYSSAILTVDLTAIGTSTYDMPDLTDDNASINANSPFGGDFGRHQAKEVVGSPVQIYATGFRNPYDIVLASNGFLYTVDNGPNAGWGGTPIFVNGIPTNQPSEPGVTYNDQLQVITAAGQYFGHPNPTRASTTNTFNTVNPQSPVLASDPQEGNYLIPGVQDGALATFGASTDGITQYTASDFNGALKGDILMTSFANLVYDAKLSADGLTATNVSPLFQSVGSGPLDLTTQGDSGQFHGTIWVVDHTTGNVVVYEPADFSGGGQSFSGVDDSNVDEDGDGFSNHDEIVNGTNPTSAADQPHSWSGVKISDLLNPDDDGDGLPDTSDPFAIDPNNGKTTNLPLLLNWSNTSEDFGGIVGMGFTGIMSDGKTNYANLYDAGGLTAGGAAGVFTIDAVTSGDALGSKNTQFDAFQVGINVNGQSLPFQLHTEIVAPFSGITPTAGQSQGFYIGTGDQDNYVKLVVTGAGNLQLIKEVGGVASSPITVAQSLSGLNDVDLYMTVDPVAGTLQASFTTTTGGNTSAATLVGSPISIPLSWFTAVTAPAVGIIATNGGGASFAATWAFLDAISLQKETPYNGVAATVPGLIQAENYDLGGEGIAYHDTTPTNLGGAYRTDGVDIEPASPSGFDVGYAVAGEWMNYTINVTTTGSYTFNPTVAALSSNGVFHIEIDGVNVTGPWTVPATGGWQTYATLTSQPVTLTAGTHIMRLAMDTNGTLGFVANFDSITISAVTITTSTPFLGSPVSLPGTLMADNYDNGGEGIAYHDTTPTNLGGAYRTAEAVDIETTTDGTPPGLSSNSSGVGFDVGHIAAGEWMQYTVSVATAGKYDINVRLASGGPSGTFHFSLDGVNVSGPVSFPSTGGWQTWMTVTVPGISFTTGTHVLRMTFDTSSAAELGNVEYLQITPSTTPTETPFLGTAFVIGQTIQADDFNNGGEGIAYHDTDSVNRGGQYRSGGVDIESITDVPGPGQTTSSPGEPYDVGYIAAGEWMEYAINVATTGVYNLDVRVASGGPTGTFHFNVDGVNATGLIVFPSTGGWQTWTTLTVTGVSLTAGTHQMRLVFDTSTAPELGNVAWFRLYTPAAPGAVIATPTAQIATTTTSTTDQKKKPATTSLAVQLENSTATGSA